MLDKQSIRTLRTFRLAIVREGPDVAVFAHPATLTRLAVWLIDAVRDLIDKDKKQGRKKGLPLVAACLDERRDAYLVVGINGASEYGDVRKKYSLRRHRNDRKVLESRADCGVHSTVVLVWPSKTPPRSLALALDMTSLKLQLSRFERMTCRTLLTACILLSARALRRCIGSTL